MCDQNDSNRSQPNNSGFIFGLILGAIVGALIAILLYHKDKEKVLKNLKLKIGQFLSRFLPADTFSHSEFKTTKKRTLPKVKPFSPVVDSEPVDNEIKPIKKTVPKNFIRPKKK